MRRLCCLLTPSWFLSTLFAFAGLVGCSGGTGESLASYREGNFVSREAATSGRGVPSGFRKLAKRKDKDRTQVYVHIDGASVSYRDIYAKQRKPFESPLVKKEGLTVPRLETETWGNREDVSEFLQRQIEHYFAGLPVDVVSEPPTDATYSVTVVVGGTPDLLEIDSAEEEAPDSVALLDEYNMVPREVVFVFGQMLAEQGAPLLALGQAAAEAIGYSFGLEPEQVDEDETPQTLMGSRRCNCDLGWNNKQLGYLNEVLGGQ